jgi:hypothetical protein
MRRQFFCAPSTSLKTMASAVLFDRQPFDRVALRVTDPDYLRLKAISFERVALPGTHFRVAGGNGTVLPLGRFVADSPLEGSGFELSVPRPIATVSRLCRDGAECPWSAAVSSHLLALGKETDLPCGNSTSRP